MRASHQAKTRQRFAWAAVSHRICAWYGLSVADGVRKLKRSFTLHLFIRLVLITFAILFSNRMLAQHFLTEQLRNQIHQDMARALTTCGDDFNHRSTFLNCFKAQDKASLISNVSDFYVLCNNTSELATAANTPICRSQLAQTTSTMLSDASHPAVELVRGQIDEDVVFSARYAVAFYG